ncbi:Sin3 associated polypeptide p18-domain-containing protein [Stachybotrys elegans]|uniref:Sin3 associated polypeptide p18-domain-containing protein n=1 Tax=Stachybotrys elegans TaxID=80388 RepID=A0A8K0WL47_9HYPO|nr:Sin3 associated polypeptide p18-domain-containing protein [Stachybotrys elegans]
MAGPSDSTDRGLDTPFLVKLFHRVGTFYRPDEFASNSPPPHVSIYTWPDCTLNELALELAATEPSLLPTPAVGTRLAFQLVYPDLRSTTGISNASPRFAVKDLGTVVIGQGSPGTGGPEEDAGGVGKMDNTSSKSLGDARFVVGDYISCAILPPLPNGSVAPAAGARREPAPGLRGGRQGYRGGFFGHDGGHGRNRRDDWRGGPDNGFPSGEWRRGERIPDGPAGRPRGRGRW